MPSIKSLKHFVTPEKTEHHAEILANRVRNRYRHLSKRFKKQNIECFRLYDWDIPEVRAVVDWYAGHIVIGEYERLQTCPDWLPQMARAVGEALDCPPENVHIRRRHTGSEGKPRYSKIASKGQRLAVHERNLRFWVNLDDFLDTGLFSDHRDTRVIIGQLAAGKDFLNLFAYTGAFSCAAAAGGAKSTVTVDRSATYLKWAKENFDLNGLWDSAKHSIVQSDTGLFLQAALRKGRRFTLAVVDPPSFFQDENSRRSFDINKDHHELLAAVFKVMRPGSLVFFSTNHQRFEPKFLGLAVQEISEITPATIPEDYRNRNIHRCWKMTVA